MLAAVRKRFGTLKARIVKLVEQDDALGLRPTEPLFNVDEEYVENPAVSEAQRKYLYSQFGEEWVHEHHFDNRGKLPERVGNYSSDQPRDAHGKWGSGAVTVAKAALAKFKEHYDKATSLPVLKQARRAGEAAKAVSSKLYSAMEARYGRKTAIAIMASAQVLSWGALGVGIAVGVPLYLPGSSIWGSIPAAAVAETFLQAKKLLKAVTNEELQSEAWLHERALEFANEFSQQYSDWLRRNVYTVGAALNARVSNDTTSWANLDDAGKVRAFMEWLDGAIDEEVLGADAEQLCAWYAEQGWRRGAARAFDDATAAGRASAQGADSAYDFYVGSRDQFLRSSFNQPVSAAKVQLLAERTYDDLEGVTDAMSNAMRRTLIDGLVQGKSPRDVAGDLTDDVDGIGQQRAETVARTEVVRAHAEGQLDALEAMGVDQVGVMVEWQATADSKTCPQCSDLEGSVLSVDDARGLLPRHPNCRCCWVPAVGAEANMTREDVVENSALDEFSEWLHNYDPDQLRDDHGRWAKAALPSAGLDKDTESKLTKDELTEYKALHKEWGKLQVKVKQGKATDEEVQRKEQVLARCKELRGAARGRGANDTATQQVKDTASKAQEQQTVAATGPGETSRAEVKAIVDEARANAKAGDEDFQAFRALRKHLEEREQDVGDVQMHGMANSERMNGVQIDGVNLKYGNMLQGRDAAARMLRDIADNPLPEKLWQANKSIVISEQKSKDDDYWAQKYARPGLVSAATGGGGEGAVVAYNSKLTVGTLAHESGHNLAYETWGRTTPPYGSDYGKAQAVEGAVTNYGATNGSEDFAEACKLYATKHQFGSDQRFLEIMFPKKFNALRDLVGEH